MDLKKLAESYKRAIEVCCAGEVMQLEEDKTFCFKVNNEDIEITYKKGFVVPSTTEKLLEKWVKINYIMNKEFEKNQKELLKFLENLGF